MSEIMIIKDDIAEVLNGNKPVLFIKGAIKIEYTEDDFRLANGGLFFVNRNRTLVLSFL